MAIPEEFLQKPVGAQHVVKILYQSPELKLRPPLQATAADLKKRGGELAFKGNQYENRDLRTSKANRSHNEHQKANSSKSCKNNFLLSFP